MQPATPRAVVVFWLGDSVRRHSAWTPLFLGLPQQLVADKRELAAIGRPGGDIDRALTAEEPRQLLDRAARQRQQPQPHGLVLRMTGNVLLIGQKHEPFAVG